MKNLNLNFDVTAVQGVQKGEIIFKFLLGSKQRLALYISRPMIVKANGSGCIGETDEVLGNNFIINENTVFYKNEDVTEIRLNTDNFCGKSNLTGIYIDGSWIGSYKDSLAHSSIKGVHDYNGPAFNIRDINLDNLEYFTEVKNSEQYVFGDLSEIPNVSKIKEFRAPYVGGDITLLKGLNTSILVIGPYNFGLLSEMQDTLKYISCIDIYNKPIFSWSTTKRHNMLCVSGLSFGKDLDAYLRDNISLKYIDGSINVFGEVTKNTNILAQSLCNVMRKNIYVNKKMFKPINSNVE